jgi:hypothetical protein
VYGVRVMRVPFRTVAAVLIGVPILTFVLYATLPRPWLTTRTSAAATDSVTTTLSLSHTDTAAASSRGGMRTSAMPLLELRPPSSAPPSTITITLPGASPPAAAQPPHTPPPVHIPHAEQRTAPPAAAPFTLPPTAAELQEKALAEARRHTPHTVPNPRALRPIITAAAAASASTATPTDTAAAAEAARTAAIPSDPPYPPLYRWAQRPIPPAPPARASPLWPPNPMDAMHSDFLSGRWSARIAARRAGGGVAALFAASSAPGAARPDPHPVPGAPPLVWSWEDAARRAQWWDPQYYADNDWHYGHSWEADGEPYFHALLVRSPFAYRAADDLPPDESFPPPIERPAAAPADMRTIPPPLLPTAESGGGAVVPAYDLIYVPFAWSNSYHRRNSWKNKSTGAGHRARLLSLSTEALTMMTRRFGPTLTPPVPMPVPAVPPLFTVMATIVPYEAGEPVLSYVVDVEGSAKMPWLWALSSPTYDSGRRAVPLQVITLEVCQADRQDPRYNRECFSQNEKTGPHPRQPCTLHHCTTAPLHRCSTASAVLCHGPRSVRMLTVLRIASRSSALHCTALCAWAWAWAWAWGRRVECAADCHADDRGAGH